MSIIVWEETKIKIEIAEWLETENVRYVYWILTYVKRNSGENARAYRIAAMG